MASSPPSRGAVIYEINPRMRSPPLLKAPSQHCRGTERKPGEPAAGASHRAHRLTKRTNTKGLADRVAANIRHLFSLR